MTFKIHLESSINLTKSSLGVVVGQDLNRAGIRAWRRGVGDYKFGS